MLKHRFSLYLFLVCIFFSTPIFATNLPLSFASESLAKQQGCRLTSLKGNSQNCVLVFRSQMADPLYVGIYLKNNSGEFELEDQLSLGSAQRADLKFPELSKNIRAIQVRAVMAEKILFLLLAWNQDHYQLVWIDEEKSQRLASGQSQKLSASHFFKSKNPADLEILYQYEADRKLRWKERFRWSAPSSSFFPLQCIRSHLSAEALEQVNRLDEKRIKFLQSQSSLQNLDLQGF